jgi:hypothetical protein
MKASVIIAVAWLRFKMSTSEYRSEVLLLEQYCANSVVFPSELCFKVSARWNLHIFIFRKYDGH